MTVIDQPDNPDVWVGRLSMALTMAAPALPKPERRQADRVIDELCASPVCHPELRQLLEQERAR